jgi:hypothetical protein
MTLKPIYSKNDPRTGIWTWGLSPEDFMKIQAGYACGECLEEFPHWVSSCPVCKAPNVVQHAPTPEEWR